MALLLVPTAGGRRRLGGRTAASPWSAWAVGGPVIFGTQSRGNFRQVLPLTHR